MVAFIIAGIFLAYESLIRERGKQPVPYHPMFQKSEAAFQYTLIPNWNGVDHGVPVTVNSEGMRGDEWLKSLGKELRILALGDSLTFGVALDYEKVYTRVLEKNLQTDKIDARVFNAAVPGWNFKNQIAFLKYIWPKVQPHAVTILFVQNDFDDSITVGCCHQLMAPKIPFEVFFRNTDAWVMESFAMAYQNNPLLDLTLGNAFKESWRLPFYHSLSHYGVSPLGKEKFREFSKDLMDLKSFLSSQGTKLFIGVHSEFPETMSGKKLKTIFQKHNIPHIFLNRWTGDRKSYLENWSLHPIDNHGNTKYHSLFSGLIQNFLTTISIGKNFKISEYKNLPDPLPKLVYQGMVDQEKEKGERIVSSIGDYVSLMKPDTQKQLVAMGGDSSQWRAIFKTTSQAESLEVIPAPTAGFSKNDITSLWVQIKDFSGFIPVIWDGNRILAALPMKLKRDDLLEIGLVMGVTENGVFTERYPVESVRLLETPLKSELLQTNFPLLITGKDIHGWFGDTWISEYLQLLFHSNRIKIKGNKNTIVRLVFNGDVPDSQYPIRLIATTGKGNHLGELVIRKPVEYNWDIILGSELFKEAIEMVQIKCNSLFMPSELNPISQDNRKLCVQLLRVEVL